MRIIIPPIKSQGIKTKLVPWIRSLTPKVTGCWIEPFMGTGVVAFNTGFSAAILGDINPHVITFYDQIRRGTIGPAAVRQYLEKEGALLKVAENKGYEHFTRIKNRFNTNHSPLDFLFLSRAGFNGMIRFNKKGEWNIPFCKKPTRFTKAYITKIVNQVRDVAEIIKPDWQFYNLPFVDIIAMAGRNDIIYCDPPYLGRYVDYYNGWNEDDEKRLFECLYRTKAKFILSTWHHNDYRRNLMVEKYWSNFNIVTQDHFYHSGGKIENRRSIVEALVFNFEATIERHNHAVKTRPPQLRLFSQEA